MIRLLIVDDHPVVRRGLHQLFSSVADVDVVGVAVDGEQAVVQARALDPDVVLMDIVMPGIDGVEATKQMTATFPRLPVVILTAYGDRWRLDQALRAGACRCLLKHSDSEDVVRAVQLAHRGRVDDVRTNG
jgi:two-component system, NarL family, response regulator LiaR